MRFAYPFLLLFLLIIPIMIYFYQKKNPRQKIFYSSIDLLKAIPSSLRVRTRHAVFISKMISLILIIFALVRPQSGFKERVVTSEGVDIMVAIDTSGSMRGLDFEEEGKNVTRLFITKKVISEFITKRAYDRIGMIVFGSEAYTQCPLTLDSEILLEFLDRLEIGMAGEATAIGSALSLAVKRMKELRATSKIVILITDGRNNEGNISPLTAADLANTYGIKVYTIGVGTKGKVPFLVDSFFGKQIVYQEADLDEETLQAIASKTDGKYFWAKDTSAMRSIYDEIDQLEKSKVELKEYDHFNDVFHYFLLMALAMLILSIVGEHTILRRLP
jgi:Ca-activated chloride channel family protein